VPPHSARRCRPPEVLTQLLDLPAIPSALCLWLSGDLPPWMLKLKNRPVTLRPDRTAGSGTAAPG
jgi:hypothetical protein